MNEIRFDCVYSDGIITLRRKNHLPTDYYFEYFAGLWSLFIMNENNDEPIYIDRFSSFNVAYSRSISLSKGKC